VLFLCGNASEESLLKRAGIAEAKGLIAVLATDTDNVFLVLTARQLNPDLYIMARAGHEDSKSKLLAAGADQVESPYVMGAINMATKVLRPEVTNFLELALGYRDKKIQMEEIAATEGIRADWCPPQGYRNSSKLRRHHHCHQIAVRRDVVQPIFRCGH
jgi:voltage-gated potassium channel